MPGDPTPTTIIPGKTPDDFATGVIEMIGQRLALATPPQSLTVHQQNVVREAIVWCVIIHGRVE